MMETVALAPGLAVPRIINGMWQVAGAHGPVERNAAIRGMADYHRAGLVAWDMADIYGPAEEWYGAFRDGGGAPGSIGLTKMVPPPGPMAYEVVRRHIIRSAARMGVDRIDLVQLHWWDYRDDRYLDAADNLLRLAREQLVSCIGLTNFDTLRLRQLVERGIPIVSNQVQYSILDTRPRRVMAPYCAKHNIRLLCYGTLLGGLISERYLGSPEPSRGDLYTASLQKYKQMIDAWGGWGLFQDLLGVLHEVAIRNRTTIPCVAVRYLLEMPCASAAIIGCRLGVSEHISENLDVFKLRLGGQDISDIESVTSRSNDLFGLVGDCGDEYRRP